ncbi:hypothetical protein [Desulfosporosinus sp. BG]|uniref:hypothetical protein n=1 Tax=Desulfosporosinus sp. BG TaxID=1633135 RepID=UPI00083AEBF0|nr:hypothetical protein [Desulfosporosinus sp. BG]
MPKFLLYPIFTTVFALILIVNVPKIEIRRLSIYGIIFGGIMDAMVHFFGYVTGLFAWTNYGPFGFIGVHIFADVTWSIFFILYFYFLPLQKPLNYLFACAGIFFSVLYYNLVIDMGILKTESRILLPLLGFVVWFSLATWGFYKLNAYIEGYSKP